MLMNLRTMIKPAPSPSQKKSADNQLASPAGHRAPTGADKNPFPRWKSHQGRAASGRLARLAGMVLLVTVPGFIKSTHAQTSEAALRFDGQAAHVDIADDFEIFDGSTPFTVEAWMKFWSLPTEDNWRMAPVPINLRGANQLRITLADGCSTPDRIGARVRLQSSGWTTPVESN